MENMARFLIFTLCVSFPVFSVAFDSSQFKEVPKSGRIAGVFMIPETGSYILNFTAATAACMFLNVTIATRTQMEKAHRHGLETCKFGWIGGRTAVVPRIKSDQNCGRGGTGLVTWNANADRKFAAFCFNAADSEERVSQTSDSPPTRTGRVQTAMPTTPTMHATPTKPATHATPTMPATPTNPPPTSAPKTPSSAESLRRSSPSSTFPPPPSPTRSPRFPSSSSSSSSSSSYPIRPASARPPPVSNPVVSSAIVVHVSSVTRVHVSSSSDSVFSRSVKPSRSLRAVPTALIVLGVVLLLLAAAAAAVWFYKLNIWPFWPARTQKDDAETEMWKHVDSETDLREDINRKYASDVTPCPGQDVNSPSE